MNRTLILLMAVAIAIACAILFLPLVETLLVVGGLLTLLVSIFFPKQTMLGLAIFLLLQNVLAKMLEVQSHFLSLLIRRSEEVIILCVFFGLIWIRMLRKKRWERTSIDVPLIAIVILAILSTARSHLVPLSVALSDLFLFLKGFLVFYIFYALNLDKHDVSKLIRAIMLIALLSLLFAFIDLIIPVGLRNLLYHNPWVEYRGNIPSVQAFFVNPGVYGWFMAFIACFALAFFIVLEKKRYLALFMCFGVGIIMSMKLKPILGTLTVLCMAFFLTSNIKRLRSIMAVLLLILVLSLLFGENVKTIFENRLYTYVQGRGSYDTARNVLYDRGFRIALDYFPFGSGLATFGGWIAAIHYSPLYSIYGLDRVWGLGRGGLFLMDTFWPYLTGQFGFFGVLLYAYILFALFRMALRVFRTSNDTFWKAFALGALLILTEGMVESIAEPIFLSPPQYYFIFACYGILQYVNSSLKRARIGNGRNEL